MINILTDNKSIKKMTNQQFINHLFETSIVHEVAITKLINAGIKATLNNKEQILTEWNQKQDHNKQNLALDLGFTMPVFFQIIEEIETAFNLKYNSK
jgi:hypothetical protein